MRIRQASYLAIVACLLFWVHHGHAGTQPDAADRFTLNVFDPSGATRVTHLHADRLSDLKGVRICELSDHMWEAYRTFPLIRQLLTERYPSSIVIPYEDLPNIYGVKEKELIEAVRKAECDAAIVGNAG